MPNMHGIDESELIAVCMIFKSRYIENLNFLTGLKRIQGDECFISSSKELSKKIAIGLILIADQ